MIGDTVSHYRITGKLGQGGMGEVYLAEDTRLGRRVALKFLPPALWNDSEAQQRLVREAQAASRLDHPHIVTIYGIEESEGRPFIHMAHVQGVPLDEYCAAKRRPIGDIIDLAIQIADAIDHAHRAGIVHRDLKPSNILVDERGRIRILDFGIASLRGAAKLTQTGMTLGTLAYAPPELAHGMPSDPPADIYSFGVVFYQMLTGRLPFEAEYDAALLYAILHEQPRPLAIHRADVPPAIQAVVSRCLEKTPEKRYANGGELLAQLRRARPVTGGAAAVTNDKPSIAVLPFANMSADPDNEYFSDGLSEELLNVLAKNPALKVTGRTSSFAFKGKQEDLRDIGHKLGVGTLLEGSVRKAGNRVRITAQLVNASDGFHLWSETYDRVLDDIFAVQDDIARSVSSAMNVALLGARPAAPTKADPESYALLLQARQLMRQITQPSLEKSAALFREVIAKSPDDARAWAGLALVHGIQAGYGFAPVRETYRSARNEVDRALALDDGVAEAHTTNGWLLLSHEFQWDEAGAAFDKARALAPNDVGVLEGLAAYTGLSGRLDEAMRLMKEATELEPLSPSTHLLRGRTRMWARDYEGGLESYGRAAELSPEIRAAHGGRCICYAQSGRPKEGIAAAMQEPSTGYRNSALVMANHVLGNRDASDAALAALIAEGDDWGVQIAGAHAIRGEADAAFEWLERAYLLRDSGLPYVKVSPFYLNLHDDPRWRAFLERLGLET